MTLQLSNNELSHLVKEHVSDLIAVVPGRLKVSFTKRGNQLDTSVEILAEGAPASIIEEPQVEIAPSEPTEDRDILSMIK